MKMQISTKTKILKAFQYKLKLNELERKTLIHWLGCNRFVWNKAFAMSLHRLEKKEPTVWYHETEFWLKLWKRSEEYGFLKDAPSQTLQQTLMDLGKAWKDGFDKKQPLKRIPRFKKKLQEQGVRFPQGFKVKGNQLFLPKIGWLRFRKSREIIGTPKNVTVKKKADGWYISIQVEQELVVPRHRSTSMISIDRGIDYFSVTSEGEFLAGANSFRKWETKLATEQRRLKNKKKF